MSSPSRPETLAIDYQRIDDREEACQRLPEFLPVYRTVYAETPYQEGEDDVQAFADGWLRRTGQPGFRLALAQTDGRVVGFSFGHQLVTRTRWWDGVAEEPLVVDAEEWPGRTLALIELALLGEYRGQGIGRQLHDLLLQDGTEERVTLLVRPEPQAEPARGLYRHLGYRQVGQMIPFQGAPRYDVMVLELHESPIE